MSDVQSVDLGDRTIAYSWSHGTHPRPLVVLHGLGDSSIHTYAPRFAITELRDTPSLFIDLPGFGEASAEATYASTLEEMADDIARLLSNLGLQRPPIFAHSMSANIAILLASRHADSTGGLILAEPLLSPEQSVLAAGIARHSETSFTSRGYHMLVRATRLQANRGDIAANAFLPPLELTNPIAMHRAATSLLHQREPSFLRLLQALPQRVELIVGELSRVNIPKLKEANFQVTVIPGAAHFMMVESARSTSCVILNTVNGMHNGGETD